MKKLAVILLMMFCMLVLGLHAARAQESIYGDYPTQIAQENPYAKGLAQARAALDRSIQSFWSAYYSVPYDYWRVVDAYYGYVNAYYTYKAYLDAYRRWERERRGFAGVVKTDNSQPGVVYIRAPIDPVAGATVSLATYVPPGQGRPVRMIGTRTTDASGRFEFSNLASDTYTYTVTKDGFVAEIGTVEVNAARVERTIMLRKKRGLTGTVVAPYNFGVQPLASTDAAALARFPTRPVANARIVLSPRAAPGQVVPAIAMIATTDGNGRFSFEQLNYAQVSITVSAPGYRSHNQVVSLGAAGPTDVRIFLVPNDMPIAVDPVRPLGQEVQPASGDLNNPFNQ